METQATPSSSGTVSFPDNYLDVETYCKEAGLRVKGKKLEWLEIVTAILYDAKYQKLYLSDESRVYPREFMVSVVDMLGPGEAELLATCKELERNSLMITRYTVLQFLYVLGEQHRNQIYEKLELIAESICRDFGVPRRDALMRCPDGSFVYAFLYPVWLLELGFWLLKRKKEARH